MHRVWVSRGETSLCSFRRQSHLGEALLLFCDEAEHPKRNPDTRELR